MTPRPAAPRPATPRPATAPGTRDAGGRYLALLSLGALGVVYGDLGTSPLYAFRESFHGHALAATQANVLGVLSLIAWSLIVVVSVKYLTFVMRADNHGEGGILILTALVTPVNARRGGGRWLLIMLGLFGAALLYGDGMITPAITVLSAVEGLSVATSVFDPYVVPLTVAILVAIFAMQRLGSGGVGRIFGPVMLVWFLTLAVLGVNQVAREPGVLAALNPVHGVAFFVHNGWAGFLVLGSVVLVLTGAEALYADMGHFGKRSIRLAWYAVVLPAVLLNYFGQGALMLADPSAAGNPFYRLAPGWALYPLVVVATLAAVIASQSLISGAFSLAMQSVQLGYSPRLDIRHTSADERGQVYSPTVNWALMLACIALVLAFRSSSNLAAAYGVAVTATMLITTALFYVVARERFGWPRRLAVPIVGLFLLIDLAFFGANLLKVPAGGWVPLVVAAAIFTVMTTWRRGRQIVAQRLADKRVPAAALIERLATDPPHRVPGTGIYMSGNPFFAPPALLHNLEHNKVLHERVLLVAVETEELPRLPRKERREVTALGHGVHQVVLHFGFMQNPHVPHELTNLELDGGRFDPRAATYFLGRETLLPTKNRGMALWREALFAFLARNAQSATAFFDIPSDRVVEIGSQVEL